MSDLMDDVIVITGAATGVGRGLAVEAASRGARVVVSDIVDAQPVADEITAAGGVAVACRTDVTDYDSVTELLRFTVERFGGVNGLVNNALKGHGSAPLDTADPAATRELFDVGILGVFHGIRAFAEALKASGAAGKRAFILNVGSEHSLGVPPHVQPISNYTVSKYATLGFTDTARRDFAGTGVQVSLLAPGYVLTEMIRAIIETMPQAAAAIQPYAQETELVARAAFDGLLEGRYIIATNSNSREFALDHARAVMAEVQRLPALPEPEHAHDGSGDPSKCPVQLD